MMARSTSSHVRPDRLARTKVTIPFEFPCNARPVHRLMHVDVSALQHDPLTGLPNRAMFDAQLDLALSLARDIGRQTGVDHCGHEQTEIDQRYVRASHWR